MTDINRELAEALGVKCRTWTTKGLYGGTYHHSDPDFTSDAGAVKLLRILMEREDWNKFVAELNCYKRDDEGSFFCDVIPEHYITTSGLLAEAALEWLRKETK